MDPGDCYHCGQAVATGVDLSVSIDGQARGMCCGGCQAVAQAIIDNGLGDYYRNRDALPNAPREAMPAIVEGLQLYDHADFQKGFVRVRGEGPDSSEREASLILEGITCSACIWLNEQHLSRLPGVTAVDINYATRRARVCWDERRVRLSEILAAIAAIGYRAHPYDTAKSEELARKERRAALWRVFVAGFGMMQVMMYAVPVYLAGDGEMTPAVELLMRWASLVLTLPVVLYSAAPFFRNSWRDLRLRRVGMDVPVALGVGAAFAASVWATLTAGGEVYFDSVTMFVFFLLSGRFLEMTARQRAVSVTEALARLMPVVAARMPAYPDQRDLEQVMAADLRAGDVVLVKPGETIPADGRVHRRGESSSERGTAHRRKRTGEKANQALPVTGGAVNIESPLLVEVVHVGEGDAPIGDHPANGTCGDAEKPPDRRTGRSHCRSLHHQPARSWRSAWPSSGGPSTPAQALWITVSVLVVSCPCALVAGDAGGPDRGQRSDGARRPAGDA
jgi:Cu2+-exporting ATPase